MKIKTGRTGTCSMMEEGEKCVGEQGTGEWDWEERRMVEVEWPGKTEAHVASEVD